MGVAEWSSTAFQDQATDWVSSECARVGIELTGDRDHPHNRPWSSTISYETSAGRMWFKVNGPGTRHEPPLVAALSVLVPQLVPELVAVDLARGWSLLRDAGPVMRLTAAPEELWLTWERILVRYADAQLQLASAVPALLETGVPDLRPSNLPVAARQLIAELGTVSVDQGGLTEAERAALESRLPTYAGWCAELDGSGIPPTIQHDDLHSSNVCMDGSVERARIIDWGDASVAHPLATMLCTLNSIAFHAECEVDDPKVRRVRDAYLEPFTTYADRVELVRYVDLARRTGCVSRAVSYVAALEGEPASTHAEYDFPVRAWLRDILED